MFKHILIPLDGSRTAECVTAYTAAISKAFDARVTALKVLEKSRNNGCTQPSDPMDWEMCRMETRSYLEDYRSRFQEAGIEAEYVFEEGYPATRIVEFIKTQSVDLVILSSHGQTGLSGWNQGSVCLKVIERAGISVLIVRSYSRAGESPTMDWKRIMVPLDGSKRAECALSPAIILARSQAAEVVLCHAIRRPEISGVSQLTQEDLELIDRVARRNKDGMTSYFDRLTSQTPVKVETKLLDEGDAVASLHELVDREQSDLVILSAHGHSGRKKWPYGCLAMSFVLHSTSSLLIIQDLKPEEIEPHKAEVRAGQRKGH